MDKYKLFLLCFINTCFALAQNDTSQTYGRIKISKPKFDSVYIKAEMKFQKFLVGNKLTAQPQIISPEQVTIPFPKISGYASPFDYNQFCRKYIETKNNDLENRLTDTVRIQIKVLDNGKAYYKDLTPLTMMSGVPAYYDKQMNAYKLDAIHWKSMNVLKQITKWEPAYRMVLEKTKFKKTTVIKQKKENLSASGILTIIFSAVPLED